VNWWDLIIQQPLINVLIVMADSLGGSFGLAIIALTVIINIAMLPLTLQQLRSTKAMQDLQPRLAELQQKYGKDRQRMAQEQMKLYKESGVKPAGCAITMLIQMPVWIALYRAVMLTLAAAPEALLNLSGYLYSWPVVFSVLPLSRDFLGMNLAQPNIFLAILVGATMWLQQKMSTTTSADPRQQQQTQMMLWLMPMMFTFLAISFPSGLALFWVTSSVVRIIIQYRVTGWGDLARRAPKEVDRDKKPLKFVTEAEQKSTDDVGADIDMTSDEQRRGAQGLGYPEKPSKTRYQPGKDRAQRRRKR
jgi:YidC/Oxa1 family membrane protein insertase